MKIDVETAREFFADPSQHVMGITPDALPDEGFQYWAHGGVCGVFHLAPWPGVWMAHYGVKPEWRGRATRPAKTVLEEFSLMNKPERIVGWTPAENRAALAFSKRLGFTVDGEMSLPSGKVIMQGLQLWL